MVHEHARRDAGRSCQRATGENRYRELQRQLTIDAPEAQDAISRGRDVIEAEADALRMLAGALDENFVHACKTIVAVQRQLVVTGMGKSGHIARKVAATFSATGTPAIFVHPGEAGHGDMGVLARGDALLVLSNSGSTAELKPIMSFARRTGIPIIGVAARGESPVITGADVPLVVPRVAEACSVNVAPTTSTAIQLALGDALAMTVMDMRGVSRRDLAVLHPRGSIGLALSPVAELMHGSDRLPLVPLDATMPQVISTMTKSCFGLAGVVDSQGQLAGVITDGDLRRHFSMLGEATAEAVMTSQPKMISAEMLAGEALQFLNDNLITAAFVVPEDPSRLQRPIGIIHMHDLLRHGLG